MARYILIDRNSGYIWGDSSDIDGHIVNGSPCEVAEALDRSIGEFIGTEYYESHSKDVGATYDIYRADVDGSEAVGNIHDGTDQELIDAVCHDCSYIGTVVRIMSDDVL